jgi:hypothetical protein
MKRTFIFVALVFLWIGAATGQEKETFIFKNKLADATNIEVDLAQINKNPLGTEVAKKAFILKKTYTYIEKGSPTSPGDKTIVRKPTIYYSVLKLNKFYKKEIKKGNMNEKVAADRYTLVLDRAYSIFDQNTQDFERYLKSLKKPQDIEEAFLSIILD